MAEDEADAEPKGDHRAGADTPDARLSGMARGTNSSTDEAPENGQNNVCSTGSAVATFNKKYLDDGDKPTWLKPEKLLQNRFASF
jgi:hypothetical protein